MDDYIMEHDVPSDYVRRDDVIDNAGRYVSVGTLMSIANDGIVKLSDIEPHIEDAVPLSAAIGIAAADVRENVRGQWIGKGKRRDMPCCSVCGHSRFGNSLAFAKKYIGFCEWCGADMRGGEKDDQR